jgi:hypothetical protein
MKIRSNVHGVVFAGLAMICMLAVLGCGTKPNAIFEDIRGKVEIQSEPGGVWQTVSAQTEIVLAAGTALRTSSDAHALIRYYDGAKTEVFGDTTVSIESLDLAEKVGTAKMVVKMLKGVAVYLVEKDRIGQFEVRTDTAVAAIKGTIFKVEVVDGATTLKVREGVVAFSTITGEGLVELQPYYMSVVKPGALPTAPTKFNAITDKELADTKVILGTGVLK